MVIPKLPLIIANAFFAYHLSSVFSPPTKSCLGCNWIFQLAPLAPHHNYPNCFHLTMGAHLLCLESITHNFQFGLEGFEHLPSMVLVLLLLQKILQKFGPPWNFLPQVHHLHGLMCLLFLSIKDIKPLQQICDYKHLKFCIETTLKTLQNFEAWCIVWNSFVLPKKYFPLHVYTSSS